MRLDKYLKVSRIIKRRTVANDACDGDRVTVNGVCGNFYSVKANGAEGYVMKKFVTLSSSAEKALNGSSTGSTAKKNYSNRAGMEGINEIDDIKVPAPTRRGDKGADVKALQQALTLTGYYNTTIDSDYGYNTEKAVKAFQKDEGLTQDGIAGAGTITITNAQYFNLTFPINVTCTE